MTLNPKTHKSYAEQIERLQERGMEISDLVFAQETLREYGYYKFSGYFYPFRKVAPTSTREHFLRLDDFINGVRFEHIVDLIKFDDKLRSLIFQGSSCFEVSLRAKVAYILGEQSPNFHLDEKFLHPKTTKDEYQTWKSKYAKDIRQAKNQEFVRHHKVKYDGNLPIWVAVEVMQFGTLNTLISNLRDNDKQKIAEAFGIQSRTLFEGIVDNLRVLRNDCVHHNRLWNSSISRDLILRQEHLMDAKLFHLSNSPKGKIYIRLVLLSYVIQQSISASTFKSDLRAHIESFPRVPKLMPEADMGFPVNWQTLEFWNS